MAVHDVIGDMLVKLKNASLANKKDVKVRFSKAKLGILEVLKKQGYLEKVEVVEDEKNPNKKTINIELRFYNKKPVITDIKRISKPGRRVYSGVDEIPRIMNGLGVTVVSTSKGIMTGLEAKKLNLGGEVICIVV
ncbi:MAG TPA: 30S ribosomal protein S8 [Spirochaetota bacterium]|nr:30S ribosomal protein S8 [Spirochaetota bacterium]HOM37928.1 30S ribosomal protein S8 [Spirochaetota bacterium]HPQ48732.1 30S ribosomal protein S8 [Spirochaetota bacterium]